MSGYKINYLKAENDILFVQDNHRLEFTGLLVMRTGSRKRWRKRINFLTDNDFLPAGRIRFTGSSSKRRALKKKLSALIAWAPMLVCDRSAGDPVRLLQKYKARREFRYPKLQYPWMTRNGDLLSSLHECHRGTSRSILPGICGELPGKSTYRRMIRTGSSSTQ